MLLREIEGFSAAVFFCKKWIAASCFLNIRAVPKAY